MSRTASIQPQPAARSRRSTHPTPRVVACDLPSRMDGLAATYLGVGTVLVNVHRSAAQRREIVAAGTALLRSGAFQARTGGHMEILMA